MPVAYLCDFDGTVSPADIGAAWVVRHAPQAASARRAALERWRRGEIGSRELTVAECRGLRCTGDQALAFARGFALDPGFATFEREARSRGDAVAVVSDGFDFYVADHLARAGLAHVPWTANHVRFEGDGSVSIEFPHPGGCGGCGNCKAQHVRRYQAMGYAVVMVGDGLSDRCGARVADRVFARGGLREWCARRGIAARPFDNFDDVAALARRAGVETSRAGA